MIVVAKAILDGLVMRTRAEILGPSSSGVAGRFTGVAHQPRWLRSAPCQGSDRGVK
jgi:hypothetical protein